MTIIITWFKDNHMYMIADATITNDETGEITKSNQLKLITHPNPKFNAGISWYGRSLIDGKTTTEWMKGLIQQSRNLNTISDFAEFIKQKINEKNITTHSGIHIAGYENDGTAEFHHITNNHQNNIVIPDVRLPFIDSGITSENIQPDSFVVNGVGYPFKIIIKALRGIENFEDYMENVVNHVKLSLFQQNVNFNFQYDNTPRGFLNKILFYLHITQWLHLYSEQPDFIGGKYSTLIIHKSYKEFDPNGNVEK